MTHWDWILLHRSGVGEVLAGEDRWPVRWCQAGDTFTLTPKSEQLSLEDLWAALTV